MTLTHKEYHALSDLAEKLIEATNDHTYWLGPVRETSLELRALLTSHDNEGPPVFVDQPDGPPRPL